MYYICGCDYDGGMFISDGFETIEEAREELSKCVVPEEGGGFWIGNRYGDSIE